MKIGELFALAAAAVTDPSPSLRACPRPPATWKSKRRFPTCAINRPILLTDAGDGSNRVFVPSQLGTIYVLSQRSRRRRAQGVSRHRARASSIEDKENEKGFLGLAFHPKYQGERRVLRLLHAHRHAPSRNTVVVSRFRVSKDDPEPGRSRQRGGAFCEVEHPFWNHNGGTIVFGPDGYLYIAVGDGGLADDPYGNGQNLKTLLGKILRIDVDHQDPGKKYAIPKDNPFVGQRGEAMGEIWAYGLRNPWRIAFDRQTGTLWCADVGQDLWEEIDLVTKGGNYGWNVREGVHQFGPKADGARAEFIEPIWEYHHDVGKSITGGHVYRGKQVAATDRLLPVRRLRDRQGVGLEVRRSGQEGRRQLHDRRQRDADHVVRRRRAGRSVLHHRHRPDLPLPHDRQVSDRHGGRERMTSIHDTRGVDDLVRRAQARPFRAAPFAQCVL